MYYSLIVTALPTLTGMVMPDAYINKSSWRVETIRLLDIGRSQAEADRFDTVNEKDFGATRLSNLPAIDDEAVNLQYARRIG